MNLAKFIVLQIIQRQVEAHPDCTAYDTWDDLKKLVEYHGNLMITLQVMWRN